MTVGITFPCDFSFKAICVQSKDAEGRLMQSVKNVVQTDTVAVRSRTHGKYVAITLTTCVSSQNSIDRVYTALRDCSDVVYVL